MLLVIMAIVGLPLLGTVLPVYVGITGPTMLFYMIPPPCSLEHKLSNIE